MQSLTIIAEVADGIGMFGFAVAGLFASAGRRIDPVGVFVSVFTTAFGGGIIRDILLDLRPFYWLSHPQWIWMTLGLTILAPVIVRRVQRFWQRRILLWADAVGLAFFAVGRSASPSFIGAVPAGGGDGGIGTRGVCLSVRGRPADEEDP